MADQEKKPNGEEVEPDEMPATGEDGGDAGAEQGAEEAAASATAEDASAPDSPEEQASEGGPPSYEELEKEVASLKDQLLRALAETENVRRRTEREKDDFSKYAIANFAREVLGVTDNLRRALEAVDDETRVANEALNNFYEGIEMTERSLLASCEQFGIKPIEALGKKFDHNYHQAMFEVEDPDKPAGTVVQEMAKGYMIHDRLLRPAMVGVSKGGLKAKAPAGEGEEPAEEPAEERAEEPADESRRKSSSSAYEKLADAVDKNDAGKPGVDKEL